MHHIYTFYALAKFVVYCQIIIPVVKIRLSGPIGALIFGVNLLSLYADDPNRKTAMVLLVANYIGVVVWQMNIAFNH